MRSVKLRVTRTPEGNLKVEFTETRFDSRVPEVSRISAGFVTGSHVIDKSGRTLSYSSHDNQGVGLPEAEFRRRMVEFAEKPHRYEFEPNIEGWLPRKTASAILARFREAYTRKAASP
ncbi:MAG: hypothetical protein V1787_03090 [Candidatus Micrarchaeota archaeon]